MAAAVAERQERVKPSKALTRRRRRERCAKRADNRCSTTSRILATPEAELLKTCGWNLEAREMRRREPPTRSTNGKGPRLNRPNGWFIEGDAKTCVEPVDSALWLWFITLETEEQDRIADLSAKCSGKVGNGGGTDEEKDAREMLAEMAENIASSDPEQKRLVVLDGEDPKGWGRVKR